MLLLLPTCTGSASTAAGRAASAAGIEVQAGHRSTSRCGTEVVSHHNCGQPATRRLWLGRCLRASARPRAPAAPSIGDCSLRRLPEARRVRRLRPHRHAVCTQATVTGVSAGWVSGQWRRRRGTRPCRWQRRAAAHGGAISSSRLTLGPEAREGPQGGGGGHAAPLLLRCCCLAGWGGPSDRLWRCYRALLQPRWALPLARRGEREGGRAWVGLQRRAAMLKYRKQCACHR